MKVGILTGGGDAPGLNGIIESVSRTLIESGHEIVGIEDGFDGLMEGRVRPITLESTYGLHTRAGTSLGTSNKSRIEDHKDTFMRAYMALKLDALLVAGGDGTFAALHKLGETLPIVGVPKTIDNDLHGTDTTFGFDTACTVVADAVDSLFATAKSHKRIMIVETMGRTAGWIALGGGLASYADAILIPERPFEKDGLLSHIEKNRKNGRRGLVFSVSESAYPKGEDPVVAFEVPGSVQKERYGGIAERLARWIDSKNCGYEARSVTLGHLQRSRPPTTKDRLLTLALGSEAAQMIKEKLWNHCAVYKRGRVERAPLSVLQQGARVVPADHHWVQTAQKLGIFI